MPPWLTCSDPATRGPATLKRSVDTSCTHQINSYFQLMFVKVYFHQTEMQFASVATSVAACTDGFTGPLCYPLPTICVHYCARSTSPWNAWLLTAHPLLLRGVLFCCRRKTLYCQTQTSPVIEGRWAWNSQSCTSVCFQPNLCWAEWKNKGTLVRLYVPLLFFHLAAVPCFSAHFYSNVACFGLWGPWFRSDSQHIKRCLSLVEITVQKLCWWNENTGPIEGL